VSPLHIELLTSAHERGSFHSGEPALDRYLTTQATQDMRRNIAKCYVVIEKSTSAITAFYTLAATGFPLEELPPALIKTLPRYPVVPAVRIGRLAVDHRFQGKKLGSALIADAVLRIHDAAPAAFAIVVDAKHEKASAFYQHHRFIPFKSQALTLFLPLESALRAMRA